MDQELLTSTVNCERLAAANAYSSQLTLAIYPARFVGQRGMQDVHMWKLCISWKYGVIDNNKLPFLLLLRMILLITATFYREVMRNCVTEIRTAGEICKFGVFCWSFCQSFNNGVQ